MRHDRLGIVFANDTPRFLLHCFGCLPWLIDVLVWHVAEGGYEVAHVVAGGVVLLAESDGGVDAEKLGEGNMLIC